jgi:hypothetical protein
MQAVAIRVEARLVAINYKGRRIGQDHHRARFTDHEIELMRQMYEEHPVGHKLHVGFRKLAVIWGCSKALIVRVVTYDLRAQHAAKFKRVT